MHGGFKNYAHHALMAVSRCWTDAGWEGAGKGERQSQRKLTAAAETLSAQLQVVNVGLR